MIRWRGSNTIIARNLWHCFYCLRNEEEKKVNWTTFPRNVYVWCMCRRVIISAKGRAQQWLCVTGTKFSFTVCTPQYFLSVTWFIWEILLFLFFLYISRSKLYWNKKAVISLTCVARRIEFNFVYSFVHVVYIQSSNWDSVNWRMGFSQ